MAAVHPLLYCVFVVFTIDWKATLRSWRLLPAGIYFSFIITTKPWLNQLCSYMSFICNTSLPIPQSPPFNTLLSPEPPRSRNTSTLDHMQSALDTLQAKTQQLSQRLLKLQGQHTVRLEALQCDLEVCDGLMTRMQESSQQQFEQVRREADSVQDVFKKDIKKLEHDEGGQLERVEALTTEYASEFREAQKKQIGEAEKNILYVKEELEQIKVSLQYQDEVNGETGSIINQNLQAQLIQIEKLLKKQQQQREQYVQKMRSQLSNFQQQLHKSIEVQEVNIQVERQHRMKSEGSLTQVLELVFHKLEHKYRT